jgi:tripartite-type tricarboxylate transporter receptor subunit TctC
MAMKIVTSICAAAVLASSMRTFADNYPSRPITVVSGMRPGGNVDVTARILAFSLNKQLGRPVIVNDRPGGDGTIGGSFVARRPPDGYTLLLASGGSITTLPEMFIPEHIPYDPLKDFVPVGIVQTVPYAIVVNSKGGYGANATLATLLAAAKQHPGAVTVGYGGMASLLALSYLEASAGVRFLTVPYVGGAPAIDDLLGGRINAFLSPLTGVITFVTDGSMKALALTGSKRSAALPNVPTVAETSPDLAGFEAVSFDGLFAPANTSPAVIATLSRALQGAVRAPVTVEKFYRLGLEPQTDTPQEFAEYIRRDIAKWRDVAAKAGIRAEE